MVLLDQSFNVRIMRVQLLSTNLTCACMPTAVEYVLQRAILGIAGLWALLSQPLDAIEESILGNLDIIQIPLESER
jgi:hypothetical protein